MRLPTPGLAGWAGLLSAEHITHHAGSPPASSRS